MVTIKSRSRIKNAFGAAIPYTKFSATKQNQTVLAILPPDRVDSAIYDNHTGRFYARVVFQASPREATKKQLAALTILPPDRVDSAIYDNHTGQI